MDDALRNALRALKRSGRKFSELGLHEFLTVGDLKELLHHIVIASLRLQDIGLFNSDKPPGWTNFEKEGVEPRIIAYTIGDIVTSKVRPLQLEDLPQKFTHNIVSDTLLKTKDTSVLAQLHPEKEIKKEIWAWPSPEDSSFLISFVHTRKEDSAKFELQKRRRLLERARDLKAI